MIRNFVSAGIGFIPVIGDIKDIQEALTGIDLITGKKLSTGERILTALTIFILVVTGKAVREAFGFADDAAGAVKGIKKAAKSLDDTTDAVKGVGKAADDVAKGEGKAWGTADDLVNSATTPGKGGVSPVGRAFQKHAGNPNRAGTFTGEVSGNAMQNTQNGTKYLNDILNNPNSTYTTRNTKAFGDVLDVRLPDGTGARWSADGKTFIGFLEKYTK